MSRNRVLAAVGQTWFVRHKGASALSRIKLLSYEAEDVWQYMELRDVVNGMPMYGEAGVDFKFVQPAASQSDAGEKR